MVGVSVRRFPDPALERASRLWTRDVEDRIIALEKSAERKTGSDLNANKAQNSSIDLVSRNIVDLDARVQEAISSITIDGATQITGLIPDANLAGLAANKLSGTVTNPVSASTVQGELYGVNITFNITTGRVGMWGRTADGFLATATSSEQFKTNIRPIRWSDEKIEAVVGMEAVYYNWKANIERRTAALDPSHEDYGKFLPNPLEIGFIAERMHEAGLWEFVVYLRRDDDSLVLNDDGQPIPFAIHYSNWALALHEVVKRLWALRKRDRADVDRILNHLGLPAAD